MSSVKLSAKWQLDAALLSRPVDLTSLVTLSKSEPDKFIEDNTIHRLVTNLLNEPNQNKSDKVLLLQLIHIYWIILQDTKLDVLNILANVAGGSKAAIAEVRVALQGISEWFDEYIASEEADATEVSEIYHLNFCSLNTFCILGTRTTQGNVASFSKMLGL